MVVVKAYLADDARRLTISDDLSFEELSRLLSFIFQPHPHLTPPSTYPPSSSAAFSAPTILSNSASSSTSHNVGAPDHTTPISSSTHSTPAISIPSSSSSSTSKPNVPISSSPSSSSSASSNQMETTLYPALMAMTTASDRASGSSPLPEQSARQRQFWMRYKDEEDELISIASDADLREAIAVARSSNPSILRIYLEEISSPRHPLTGEPIDSTPFASLSAPSSSPSAPGSIGSSTGATSPSSAMLQHRNNLVMRSLSQPEFAAQVGKMARNVLTQQGPAFAEILAALATAALPHMQQNLLPQMAAVVQHQLIAQMQAQQQQQQQQQQQKLATSHSSGTTTPSSSPALSSSSSQVSMQGSQQSSSASGASASSSSTPGASSSQSQRTQGSAPIPSVKGDWVPAIGSARTSSSTPAMENEFVDLTQPVARPHYLAPTPTYSSASTSSSTSTSSTSSSSTSLSASSTLQSLPPMYPGSGGISPAYPSAYPSQLPTRMGMSFSGPMPPTGMMARSGMYAPMSSSMSMSTTMPAGLMPYPAQMAPTTPPVFNEAEWEHVLSQLRQMGFEDRGRNLELIRAHRGSMVAVVEDLLLNKPRSPTTPSAATGSSTSSSSSSTSASSTSATPSNSEG